MDCNNISVRVKGLSFKTLSAVFRFWFDSYVVHIVVDDEANQVRMPVAIGRMLENDR